MVLSMEFHEFSKNKEFNKRTNEQNLLRFEPEDLNCRYLFEACYNQISFHT